MLKKIMGLGIAACMLALLSTSAVAQNLVENWSFEEPAADSVDWPGYFHNQEASVTGWTVTTDHGLNNNIGGSADDGQRNPFHGGGRPIPDGDQVLFMQGPGHGVLSQEISGMEDGNAYMLIFYSGIRPGNDGMDLWVELGGVEMLERTTKLAAGTAPYVRYAIPFIYDESEMGANPALEFHREWPDGGDQTILFDAIEIRSPQLAADISGPGMVAQGDNIAFNVSLSESVGDATYQWYYDGVELDGETGATLELLDVVIEDSGVYSVEVNDAAGSTTTAFTLVVVEALPLSSVVTLAMLALMLAGAGFVAVRRVRA